MNLLSFRSMATVALALGACLTSSLPAHADAVAYPPGSFALPLIERSIVIWDAAKKEEHLIKKVTLEGDAPFVVLFIATPTQAEVTKIDDGIIDRVAGFVPDPAAAAKPGAANDALPGGPRMAPGMDGSAAAAAAGMKMALAEVARLPKVTADEMKYESIRGTGVEALTQWLGKNGVADRPSLHGWALAYLSRGWVISAVRMSSKGATATPDAGRADAGSAGGGEHAIETATLKFSFPSQVPFYPYTEAPPEDAQIAAFHAKYTETWRAGFVRPLQLWVVSDGPVASYQGAAAAGPTHDASAPVAGNALGAALGATDTWGFDPKTVPRWTVSRLVEGSRRDRVAFDDLTFRAYDAPVAPTPDVRSTRSPSRRGAAGEERGYGSFWPLTHRRRNTMFGLLVLALALGVGIVFAMRENKG